MPAVHADTLKEVLAAAYIANPQVKAQRANLRAIDEEVSRAKSGYRPTIQGEAVHSYRDVSSRPPSEGDGDSYPRSYSISLNQPLFRGFRTVNAVEGARANVEAGREDLRDTAQQVLLDGITQYMNVLRDQSIVRLRQNNVEFLTEQLQATQDRFEVGEVTRTDVAQAEAARSGAISELNLAKANLKTSRAAYERVIGFPPRDLQTPQPADRLLPSTLEAALKAGEMRNPQILAGLFRVKATEYDTKVVKGELLPEVQLEASYEKSFETGGFDERDTTTITGRMTVPIYQAGEVSARVRQAQDTELQRRQEVDQARQQVRADVVSAWGQFTAARAALVSDRAQVEANEIALEGVRAEEQVGQRTVLDVLDAEQALLDSQVSLVTSRRDLVVASYTLLAAIGRLTPSDLNLPTDVYDPDKHYREVKDRPFGFHWTTSVLPIEDTTVVGGDAVLEPGQELADEHAGHVAESAEPWVVPEDGEDPSLK
ncbi:MAG: TolC family outer membrane protein [Dichotomicrobium sp.]